MSTSDKTNQQWGGRFSEPTDAFVARFTASVDFDQRMYKQDIQGSIGRHVEGVTIRYGKNLEKVTYISNR